MSGFSLQQRKKSIHFLPLRCSDTFWPPSWKESQCSVTTWLELILCGGVGESFFPKYLMMGPDDFCPIELIPIPNIPLISHLPFSIHSLRLVHEPGIPHSDLSVLVGGGGGVMLTWIFKNNNYSSLIILYNSTALWVAKQGISQKTSNKRVHSSLVSTDRESLAQSTFRRI